MECSIGIRISSEDVAMLKRIAKSQNRRFHDFLQLVFAEGLECFFVEDCVSVKKLPQEYTKEERKQEEINKKIQAEHDDYDSRKAAGFSPVRDYLSNHEYNKETNTREDKLILPMAQRVREIALD